MEGEDALHSRRLESNDTLLFCSSSSDSSFAFIHQMHSVCTIEFPKHCRSRVTTTLVIGMIGNVLEMPCWDHQREICTKAIMEVAICIPSEEEAFHKEEEVGPAALETMTKEEAVDEGITMVDGSKGEEEEDRFEEAGVATVDGEEEEGTKYEVATEPISLQNGPIVDEKSTYCNEEVGELIGELDSESRK